MGARPCLSLPCFAFIFCPCRTAQMPAIMFVPSLPSRHQLYAPVQYNSRTLFYCAAIPWTTNRLPFFQRFAQPSTGAHNSPRRGLADETHLCASPLQYLAYVTRRPHELQIKQALTLLHMSRNKSVRKVTACNFAASHPK